MTKALRNVRHVVNVNQKNPKNKAVIYNRYFYKQGADVNYSRPFMIMTWDFSTFINVL